jgi:hydrogenase nickel incorporation protein HypA/HybF
MHEFSIVQDIVDIVLKAAEQHGLDTVSKVELEVGQAAGVVQEAMEFAWESAIKSTRLEKAVLEIRSIPLEMQCSSCGIFYQPAEIFEPCPACGGISNDIRKGMELRVTAIIG